jgi:hypothetical protein
MSPTICHDNDTALESDEMCESINNKELNHNVIIKMDEDNVKEHKGRGEYFLLKKSMCGLF